MLFLRCWQDCAPERLKAPGCWLKASVTTSQANPCRNYRVLGLSKVKSEIKPWFPTNTLDADNIGTNKWKPKMDRMWYAATTTSMTTLSPCSTLDIMVAVLSLHASQAHQTIVCASGRTA